MPLNLPKVVADYFAADSGNGAAVADCFATDAIVVDEGQTHRGRHAIARWKAAASAKYDYVVDPMAIEDAGSRVVVTAHLTGNFPGSPVDLRYAFTIEADKIARLEIGA